LPERVVQRVASKVVTVTKTSLDPALFDALICDCDGTLVDSAGLYFRSLRTVFETYGLPFEREWYYARTGLTPFEMLDVYREQVSAIPAVNTDVAGEVTRLFQQNRHTLEEVTIVADVVRAWHGVVPMAVASNGQRANVEGSLKAVGLYPYFDTVVTIDDVKHGKPAPDIYLEAAHRLKKKPDRCFVLEDSDEGLQAAYSAGMGALDVRPYTVSKTHES
jgi:beta-phosphoglucomutase-like phosphatase (HAD superfamily)